MSFSSTVKNELCRIENIQKCCLIAELAGALRISGTFEFSDDGDANIKIVTENAAFARRIFSLLKSVYGILAEITAKKSKKLKEHVSYVLNIGPALGSKKIIEDIGIIYEKKKGNANINYSPGTKKIFKGNCCKRAYLRGAFLAGGSVSDPEKTYHLEIVNKDEIVVREICELLGSFGLNAKIITRKGAYVAYIKEGGNIVDFLNIIGAHTSLMNLENVRIIKGMRNDINRLVNCETANLGKTVNASVRQIESIKHISDTIGFENIPDNLREIAKLRLENRDMSLKELGELINPVLSRSGVNHRLKRLNEISASIKKPNKKR